MEAEIPLNSTSDLHLVHPCYVLDTSSLTLSLRPSLTCVSLYTFLLSLSVVTVGGNLLVITSISYFKQLHTPTNLLLLSLAATDLLVGVLVFPFNMAVTVTLCWYHRSALCNVRGGFDMLLSTCSIMNLCCISVDRYYAVCHPLTYAVKVTQRVAGVMVLLSWGVSAVFASAFSVAQFYYESCSAVAVLGNTVGPLFSFYLPLIVIICIYLKIFTVAQRQVRSIRSVQSSVTTATERKATKTLALVVGVFLLCWAPFFLCFTSQLVPVSALEALNWFTLANSTFNPFIYAAFYSWFRAAFRMIVTGRVWRGDCSDANLF